MGSFSIWHWLIVLILCFAPFGACYGIYRYAKRTPPNAHGMDGLAGVGGWLLFLVFWLMFLGPYVNAARLYSNFVSAESQHPNLRTLTAWGDYKNETWFVFIVVACLSFYAGMGLAKGRDMSVVRRAKVLLWVTGPAAYVVMNLVIPNVTVGKLTADPQFIGKLIASTFMAGIWTAYLSKSKRVRSTYGVPTQQ